MWTKAIAKYLIINSLFIFFLENRTNPTRSIHAEIEPATVFSKGQWHHKDVQSPKPFTRDRHDLRYERQKTYTTVSGLTAAEKSAQKCSILKYIKI